MTHSCSNVYRADIQQVEFFFLLVLFCVERSDCTCQPRCWLLIWKLLFSKHSSEKENLRAFSAFVQEGHTKPRQGMGEVPGVTPDHTSFNHVRVCNHFVHIFGCIGDWSCYYTNWAQTEGKLGWWLVARKKCILEYFEVNRLTIVQFWYLMLEKKHSFRTTQPVDGWPKCVLVLHFNLFFWRNPTVDLSAKYWVLFFCALFRKPLTS